MWRSSGFLKGWVGQIAKRRVLPAFKALKFNVSDKWLDMGCGPGFNFRLGFLLNKNKNLKIYGIDLSNQNIKIAKEEIKNSKFDIGNVEKLPYENEFFDKITYLHVIEHVPNPLQSLRELKRVLKFNGVGSICFQNKYGIENLGMGFSKKLVSILGGDKAGFDKPSGVLDVRRSYFEIKKMCEKAGLKVIRVDGAILMLPSLAWRIPCLRKLTLIISDFLEKLPLIKYFSSYICITVIRTNRP